MKLHRVLLLGLVLLLSLFPVTAQAKPISPDDDPLLPSPAGVKWAPSSTGDWQAGAPAAQAIAPAMGAPGVNLVYQGQLGHFQEPFPFVPQVSHLYGPNGLALDASGNLYVVEETGSRLLRFSTTTAGPGTVVAGVSGVTMHHDQFLSNPKDVTVGPDGNLWMVMEHAVKVHAPNGDWVTRYPDDAPWESGSADNRFNTPRGIAFDANGYLFVSDSGNHRIQIFNVTKVEGEGEDPDVYTYTLIKTIGVTGESNIVDNAHFNQPGQIAFDDSNALYIVDTFNYRVQKCTTADAWVSVTCTTFFGGTEGNNPGAGQLGYATSVAIDRKAGADDIIYLSNARYDTVLKCTLGGACSVFLGQIGVPSYTDPTLFSWASSLEVDSAGNVYVADWDTSTIRKYSSAGALIAVQAGVMGEPYVTQPGYFNQPWGITVDKSGSLFVQENYGRRLIKLNADGSQAWAFGEPGRFALSDRDNTRLGSSWGGPEGSPAIDAAGRIYVADVGHGRVQVFNPDGSYSASILGLGCPSGVAIHPTNGDILVADHCTQTIEVYSAGLAHKTSIGERDVHGSDNAHFFSPWDLAVDAAGAVYVADSDNFRIQKCVSADGLNYTCSTLAGVTGETGRDFSHFYPQSVAVDAKGRVFVVDSWYPRLLVYDKNGAYLASTGDWGYVPGQFTSIGGVAVGPDGTVYVSDRMSAIIQKFTLGLHGWRQVNPDGFGDRAQDVTSLALFNGTLYAGTYDTDTEHHTGAQVWRKTSSGWEQVVFSGWSDSTNIAVDFLYAHQGYLYAGTWNDGVNGGQLYRTANGTTWQPITQNGFGDVKNGEFFQMFPWGSQICVSTWRQDTEFGTEVWCSATGGPGAWTEKATNGFGDANNSVVLTWASYLGAEYAGTVNSNGAVLWRKAGTADWVPVPLPVEPVDVSSVSNSLSDLQVFDGALYAIINRRGDVDGGAILLRCQACDGTDWSIVPPDGFGDSENRGASALALYGRKIVAVMGNGSTGIQVWSSSDGETFELEVTPGFGSLNNNHVYWGNAVLSANGTLYIGTQNPFNGGEIWSADSFIFLPSVRR